MNPGCENRLKEADFEIWHVAIPVQNLERSIDFYCQRLGFGLVGRDEYPSKKQAFVTISPGGFTIELFEPQESAADSAPRRPDHLAFECRDLESFRKRLINAGLADLPEVITFESGTKYLSLTDPDGVPLEFFQGRKIYEDSISDAAKASLPPAEIPTPS